MMVPPPRSAPSTRQDVISSILSDYGNLSSHNSPYGSSVYASSPMVPPKTPKDKPLPPLVTALEMKGRGISSVVETSSNVSALSASYIRDHGSSWSL